MALPVQFKQDGDSGVPRGVAEHGELGLAHVFVQCNGAAEHKEVYF